MVDTDWEVIGVGPSGSGGSNDDWEVVGTGPTRDTSPQNSMQKLGSALLQVVDIPTFGFAEEIGAGGNALIDALFGSSNFSDIGNRYEQYLNPAREERQQFREENPYLSFGLSLPGAFLLPMGAAGQTKSALQAAKAAAAMGAAQGGLQGFGEGEGFKDRAERAAIGVGLGGAIGGGISGLGSGVQRAWQNLPFRKAAQESMVGKQLKEFAGNEGIENLSNALKGGGISQFGQKTFAELAQTPGAAALESQVKKIPSDDGGNLINALLEGRQAQREQALADLVPDFMNSSAVDRGALVRALGEPIINTKMGVAQKLFEDLPRNESVHIGGLPEQIKSSLSKVMTERVQELPRDVAKQLDDFVNLPTSISINKAQKLLQEIPEVADNNNLRGEVRAVLTDAAKGIKEALGVESAFGNQAATEFLDKQQYYREVAQKYKGAVGQNIAGKGAYGAYQTLEENILRPVINQPSRAKEYATAFGKNQDMMTQARGALLDDMAMKDKSTWAKYFEKKEPVFKELFGEDYGAVRSVIDDLVSEQSVGKLATAASKGQSATAQFQTVAKAMVDNGPKLIRLLARGGFATGSAAGIGGAALGLGLPGTIATVGGAYALNKLAQKAEANMRGLLLEAIRDPSFAYQLVQKATPENIKTSLTSLISKATIPSAGSGLASALLDGRLENGDSQSFLGGFANGSLTHQSPNPESQSPSLVSALSGVRSHQNTSNTLSEAFGGTGSNPKLQEQSQPKEQSSYNNYRPQSDTTQGESSDMYNPVKWQGKEVPFESLVDAVGGWETRGLKGDKADNAVSPKGAAGFMQVMPATAKEVLVKLGEDPDSWNPKNREMSRRVGSFYLNELLDQFDGNIELALAAYNAGPGRVEQWIKRFGSRNWETIARNLKSAGSYDETVKYVPGVAKRLNQVIEV